MTRRKTIINTLLTNKNSGILCLFLAIFTSFYYPIGATLIIAAGVPSTPVNIFIRAICAGGALYLIVIWFLNERKKLSFTPIVWFVVAFWVIYSTRILYDLNRGIRFSGYPNSIIYGITFGSILLPLIAIILWSGYIELKKLPKVLIGFFAVANVMVFFTLIIQNGGFSMDMFMFRPHIANVTGEQKANILNPIQIGLYGELLALMALYFLLIVKNSRVIIYLPLFFFGFMMLIFGASRGPFVSCILCMLLLLFYRYRISKSRAVLTLKYVGVCFIFVQIFNLFFSLREFAMYGRLYKFVTERGVGGGEGKKEYRDIQFASAWNDFLESPIIGNQFVGTYDTFYPHNIIIELLMATGIVGAVLFGGFFIPLLLKMWKSFRNKDNEYFFLTMVLCPLLIGNMFSGCLFQSVDLWLMMVLAATFPVKKRKKIKVLVTNKKLVNG